MYLNCSGNHQNTHPNCIAGLNLAFLSLIPASDEVGKLPNTGADPNDCLVPKGQKTKGGGEEERKNQ